MTSITPCKIQKRRHTEVLWRATIVFALGLALALFHAAALADDASPEPAEPATLEEQSASSLDEADAQAPEGETEGGKPADQPKKENAGSDGKIAVNLRDASIDHIVKFISDKTGKAVIIQNGLSAKVNAVSPTPLPLEDALDLVYTSLLLEDIVVIETDSRIAIVKADKAAIIPLPLADADGAPSASMMMKMIPLNYAQAEDIASALSKSAGPGGDVTPVKRTNALMVKGNKSAIAHVEALLEKLDVAEARDVTLRVFSLKNVDAKTTADLINEVLKVSMANGAPGAAIPPGLPPEAQKKMQEQMNKQGKGGSAQGGGGGTSLVVILPDMKTNRIIVAAHVEKMAMIEELVTTLDQPGEEAVALHRLEIVGGNVENLANLVESIWKGLSASAAEKQSVRAIGHAESGSLFILCSEDKFVDIKKVVDQLNADVTLEMELFQLEFADVSQVSPILQNILASGAGGAGMAKHGQKSGGSSKNAAAQFFSNLAEKMGGGAAGPQPVVIEDARLNALIVVAPREQLDRVGGILSELDVDKPTDLAIRVVDLKGEVNVSWLSYALRDMYRDIPGRARSGQEVVEISSSYWGDDKLLVLSSEKNYNEIVDLIRKIEGRDVDLSMHTVPVNYRDTNVLAEMVNEVYKTLSDSSETVHITPHLDGRSLLIMASAENFSFIHGLIRQLDNRDSPSLEIFQIEHMAASEMLNVVEASLEAGYGSARRNATMSKKPSKSDWWNSYSNRGGSKNYMESGAKMYPDERTNSLIVVGLEDEIELVRTLIAKLDHDMPEDVTIRILDLEYSSADDLSNSISRVAKRLPKDSSRDVVEITATEDDRRLLIYSSEENFRMIEKLAKDMDIREDVELTFITLEYADATDLASLLGEMLSRAGSYNGGRYGNRKSQKWNAYALFSTGREGVLTTKGDVSVIAETRTNSLMVAASPDDLKMVQAVIADLDRKREDQVSVHIATLSYTSATGVADAAVRFFPAASTSPRDEITILSNSYDNSIMVLSSEENWERINKFIKEMDSEDVEQKGKKTYELKHVDAQQLADQLEELFDTAQQGNSYWDFWYSGPSQKSENYNFVASPIGNRLMVFVPPQEIKTVDALVEELDTPEALNTIKPKVYYIKHTDATQMKDILTDLFEGGDVGGSSSPYGGYYIYRSGDSSSSASDSLVGEVNFVVDRDANALIAFASNPNALGIVDNLIIELDEKAPELSNSKTISLYYADAMNISTLLNSLYGGAIPRAPGSGQSVQQNDTVSNPDSLSGLTPTRARVNRPEYEDIYYWWMNSNERANEDSRPISTLIEQVRIVPDLRTNVLVVTAAPHHLAALERVIAKLDRPEPQVMINARLVKISQGDEERFGVRWTPDPSTISPEELDNAVLALGNLNVFENFGEGYASEDGEAPSKNVIGADVNLSLLLQLLLKNSDSKIVQDTELTVSNNETSHVFVGDDVPFITESQVNAQGLRNDSFAYREVGTRLDITPHINPKRQVVIEIDLNAAKMAEGEMLFGGAIFNRQTYSTEVALDDGQTVVLGGILSDSMEEIVRKVPVLGDLWLIGPIFRKTDRTEGTMQLVAFVTPTVMWNRFEADFATQKMMDDAGLEGKYRLPIATPTEEQERHIQLMDDQREQLRRKEEEMREKAFEASMLIDVDPVEEEDAAKDAEDNRETAEAKGSEPEETVVGIEETAPTGAVDPREAWHSGSSGESGARFTQDLFYIDPGQSMDIWPGIGRGGRAPSVCGMF
jgi:type II secretion system protein D